MIDTQNNLGVRHGWLSPEGQMHEVSFEGHSDFADSQNVSQDVLYKRGWIKLSSSSWYGDEWLDGEIKVTQRQYDYLYDWHTRHGKVMPARQFVVD